LNKGRGSNTKYLPYAFTELGVAMLSSVLRSPLAIQVNIGREELRNLSTVAKFAIVQPEGKRMISRDDEVYHIGASIKDLGKKWFAFTLMHDIKAAELINKMS
jgi:hypothetical protein